MQRSFIVRLELFLLAVIVLFGWLMVREPATIDHRPAPERSNLLFIGPTARHSGPIDIDTIPPMDLKGKTREDIAALRRRQVLRYRDVLVQDDYMPIPALLAQVDGTRPWWGLEGEYFYDQHWPGERNIQGASEESRFLLNPLLLVGLADIAAATDLDLGETWDLQTERFDGALPPAYQGPRTQVWWPAQSRAEVRYDVGEKFRRFLREGRGLPPKEQRRLLLYLTAYNAQDFGFHWMLVSLEHSVNVSQEHRRSAQPFLLAEFIHVGGSCAYPGGCNNASPSVPELNWFRIPQLPARLQVHLWKEQPVSAQIKPDMIFDLWIE